MWSLHACRLQNCWLQGCRVAGCRAASCRGEGCKGCATSCRAAVHATAVSTPTQAWTLAGEYLIIGPELPNTKWWWVLRVSLCGIGCSPACVGGSSERGPGEGRAHRPGHPAGCRRILWVLWVLGSCGSWGSRRLLLIIRPFRVDRSTPPDYLHVPSRTTPCASCR